MPAVRDREDDALAALRALAVVELARRSRRGDWRPFAICFAFFALLVAAAEEHLGVPWLSRLQGRVGGFWGGQ